MNPLKVRLVTLKPLRMACTSAYGTSPEIEAWQQMERFIAQTDLLEDSQSQRYFGHNIPDTTSDDSSYGYRVCVTCEGAIHPLNEVQITEFQGGYYAVTQCKGIENVYTTWKALDDWVKENKYRRADHQWFEEAFSRPGETPLEDIILDLHLPIQE
jgi:DNA gyrase inhibitor GyrI